MITVLLFKEDHSLASVPLEVFADADYASKVTASRSLSVGAVMRDEACIR